ncbi:transcription factor TFIIIB component B'' homolog [Plectropomus leopardus]|uniref:transcription factor TFIIIB component B'' homolog n=1 Tax=Plectropomus leopardus TaxID=160734 RepID=UPI001C4AB49B|nr:transcription factor TFIIIB component B'' homolog [Plectropomus leopardus]
MFRRSRFSIRPNVGTAGRTAATPQETPSASQEASETPKDVSESSTAPAETDNTSVVTPSEKPTASGDGNDQNGEGTSSSAAVQRRKRFSIKPKVAPGRTSALARTPKSPIKAVSETLTEVPVSDLDKLTTSSQTGTSAAPQRLQSPRRRRSSEESKQPKIQPKPTLISSDSTEPSAAPSAEDSAEQTHLPTESGKELESTSGSQVKEFPFKVPDKVPPSLPDKDAIEISEKAKTLVSSKCGLSLSPPAFSLSRLLNDPSDIQRLAKAQKLRELLKQEMNKEKKLKKDKARVKEYTLDPAKMTMRDLIRYLPLSNPMPSTLEESAQENETVVPPSPAREESPERAQQPEVTPEMASTGEEEEAAEAGVEDEEDEGIMVPQVKVAEDGSLIIDEESLTVEVQRAKGPNPAQDRDPIFERGSTTTYSSFRKGTYTKPWSGEETDMFFLAISMVGTDFSMICQLFPHRARSEIKNKFKKEERENSWRIDKAFRERRKLDIEYFSKLLEKILEVQKNRKKLKSLAGKKSPKKPRRKAKEKKAARKLSVVEEEDEEEQNQTHDLEEEEEGEKENEDLRNDGETPDAKPKKKRKRKNKQDDSTEEPKGKKNKMGEKRSEQDEACIPEDAEAALPEGCPNSDMSEKTENGSAAKDTTIKPAKLSRSRAPKPLLPLGRKWGKKSAAPSTKASDGASDKGDESVNDGASKEQVNKDASPKKKSANDDISSEEEDATIQPPRPTRYGRVPKPTKPLNYPAKEAAHSSETTPASPPGSTASAARPKPKGTAKRGRSSKSQSAQESKKPKLVTLRASQSEYSDEEDERQRDEELEEEDEHSASSKDSTAPVFVPASLRSPHPVTSEVEETMEELDILANMSDVLSISQDALCPDASCEQAQNETGTAEPFEHQLDLLVDVIDFLSSEHTEVAEDESYNEAAQTLLTIGNMAHISQSAQNQIAMQDHIAETTPVNVNETSHHQEEENSSMPATQEETSATPLVSETSGNGVTETSESVITVEQQNSTTHSDDLPIIKSSDLRTGSDMDPTPQLHSSLESLEKNSPQTRKGRLPKVKPKPNLGQASRAAKSKSSADTSAVQAAEESCAVAPDFSQATETLSAAEEVPEMADSSQKMLKETSCIEARFTEEPSGRADYSAPERQNFSEAQFEPSKEQATRETAPSSDSTDEKLISHIGTTESSFKRLLASNIVATESQVSQGSNRHSVPVQESSDCPAPCVTPVQELPVSQKEEVEVASNRQTRRNRYQRVKPNLAQTSRNIQLKPQTTQDTIENDTLPSPAPKFHKETITEVEAEPTCTTSPEKPGESPDSASDLTPSLDLGSTLTPTEDLSTTEEKNIDAGVIGQMESSGAASDQSASENKTFSEAHGGPSREQATIDTRPTFDSVPVRESSDHPALCVIPVQELSVSQEEESKVASTCKTRRSRFQKVKPNLQQTSRTVHSKPQTSKDTAEKYSKSTPAPEFPEKTIAEVEAEPICTTSTEKPSQSPGPASDSIPSLDVGSTLTPTDDLSTTEEKNTDVGVAGQVESGGATSDQCASENQTFSESDVEPSREQATKDTRPTSDSVPVKKRTDCLASCVKPVQGLPVSQEEESKVESKCQTRRSRFPKVKPSLAQTSRTARSTPQTTKDIIENVTDPTPNTKFHDKTVAAVEAEPTCTTSTEKPGQSPSPASDLTPSLDLASTLTPTDKVFTAEEKNTDVGVVAEVKSENDTFSEAHVEPSREQAARDKRPTSDSVQSSDHPALCVTPVQELSVSQEEETKVASTCKIRRSRFQKVKPNLAQTSRTVHSKPQTTKDTREKDSSPDPNPKFLDQTIAAVEAEPTCTTSPEKPSPSHSDSTLTPTDKLSTAEDKKKDVEVGGAKSVQSASENQNFSETLFESSMEHATRDTQSTPESRDEKLIPHVGTAESRNNLPTSDVVFTESQVGQRSNIDSVSILESSDHLAQLATPLEELPFSQKGESEVASISQTRKSRLHKVKPNIPQTSRAVRSKPQTTKDPVTPMQLPQKTCRPTSSPESTTNTIAELEAKPTCSTTPEPSLIKSTGTAPLSIPPLESCSTHKPTKEVPLTEEQKTDVECGQDSNSESSGQNVLQRRRRFSKVKPNLGSSQRTTRTKLQANKPSEQCHMDISLTSEQQPVNIYNVQPGVEQTADIKHLTSAHCSLYTEPPSSAMLGPVESEKSSNSTNDNDLSSDGAVIAKTWAAENQFVLTDSVLENKTSETPTVEGDSTGDNYDKVEARPTSQWKSNQDMSIGATETNTQSTDDPTAVSDAQSSKDGSAESKIESMPSTDTQSSLDPKESVQVPRFEVDCEAVSQDAVQQCPETTDTNQTAVLSTDNNQSEAADCASRKPPQTRRGRLIKPKPSLSCSSRPRKPQPVQETKQADAGNVDASVCHKPVSESRPDIQEPVEGGVEQCSDPNSSSDDARSLLSGLTQVMEQLSQPDPPPDVAGSSLSCLKQVPYSCTQDASTSSTEGTQSFPSLTLFPDMLSQQAPSDPDEPFFILSLTEIPVCSAGEELGSTPEPLTYLPLTDASVEQQSATGESPAAAGDRLLSNVAVPVSMEESRETGRMNVIDNRPDRAAYIGSITESPVDPQGAAKLQVKPNKAEREQASKTLAAKEAEPIPIQTNTTQLSELPGPSVQPKTFDDIDTEQQKGSGDHVDAEKETQTSGEDPEDSSSGETNKRRRGTSSRNRKLKGIISETNTTADSPPSKAASKGAKVKTPTAGKQSNPTSTASASHDVAPTPKVTEETSLTSSTTSPTHIEIDDEQTSEHNRLCSDTTPSTPSCPAEQSVESISVEEEPTSVSQYFLRDIFTEVDDG